MNGLITISPQGMKFYFFRSYHRSFNSLLVLSEWIAKSSMNPRGCVAGFSSMIAHFSFNYRG